MQTPLRRLKKVSAAAIESSPAFQIINKISQSLKGFLIWVGAIS